jgi:predicted acylesterase/phospholipase RssA
MADPGVLLSMMARKGIFEAHISRFIAQQPGPSTSASKAFLRPGVITLIKYHGVHKSCAIKTGMC